LVRLVGDTHGMGSAEEADTLYPAEDALVGDLSALGLRFVARLRSLGAWQLTFMGPPGLERAVKRLAETHLRGLRRPFSTLAKIDPVWTVRLDDIHEVTNLLTNLAQRFHGEYDRWETSVEAE
jgi:hypothetical protein